MGLVYATSLILPPRHRLPLETLRPAPQNAEQPLVPAALCQNFRMEAQESASSFVGLPGFIPFSSGQRFSLEVVEFMDNEMYMERFPILLFFGSTILTRGREGETE